MLKFSANLTMLFTEVEFMRRFRHAAGAGFEVVEYLFPYAYGAKELSTELKTHGLTQAIFNLPAGSWEKGERGIALLPDRRGEFRGGVALARQYAEMLECPRVNCLVGLMPDLPPHVVRDTLTANLRFAAEELGKAGIRLLVEALNTRDVPGFYLHSTADAVALIREVNHENIFYQYDAYHMQIMEGDLTETIRRNICVIEHIQIADNPGRHEPGTGEINYQYLLQCVEGMGYEAFIGCEYKPLGKTEEGLKWIKPYAERRDTP
jgi:hydroxypyruvate isomerase